MSAGLFKEPVDLEGAYVMLSRENAPSVRFIQTAIIACGRSDRWSAVIEQLARLLPAWDASPWPDQPLYDFLGAMGLRRRNHLSFDGQPSPAFRSLGFESERVNAAARQILQDRPAWYPCQLPLTREERRYWQRLDRLPEDQ